MEQLVAPIALYPDPLVGLILPASTMSADIELAARYLNSGGDPNDVESQAWDDSVKALTHYPELVQWLSENLNWTVQLGDAYANQPNAVMAAIQRSRARAVANGILVNTPQQRVIIEDGNILIIPAQTDAIYIPRYDPEIIFLDQSSYYYPGPLITFGAGFGVGWWLGYDCDWGHRVIWFDEYRREHWRNHHDWRQSEFSGSAGSQRPTGWRQWKPRLDRSHNPSPTSSWYSQQGTMPQPAPLPGSPKFDRNQIHLQPRPEKRKSGHAPPKAEQQPPTEHQQRPPTGYHPVQPKENPSHPVAPPALENRTVGHEENHEPKHIEASRPSRVENPPAERSPKPPEHKVSPPRQSPSTGPHQKPHALPPRHAEPPQQQNKERHHTDYHDKDKDDSKKTDK